MTEDIDGEADADSSDIVTALDSIATKLDDLNNANTHYNKCISASEMGRSPGDGKVLLGVVLRGIFNGGSIPKSVKYTTGLTNIWFNLEGCNTSYNNNIDSLIFSCPSSSINSGETEIEIGDNDMMFCY